MFDGQPTLELLFEQLGLDADQASMDQFIESHQLPEGVMMHQADFWSDAQRQFLSSHWQKDDEWAIVVDTLNELLSQNLQKNK
ncbi:hypothetical protein A7P53_07240 [Acinetobacter defluvii]|uniref:DUF2789 domain-containing protein n=1 Tax=Acinetobacter defluvii TaxID=1871111 RepID=A0A2S2FAP2_9GAMM|nr:DUF2789 family protein [Acinetobacter defluvii]AWL28037.1 DUF2789 domain-containing protein [Acinetobacter defluvii]NNP72259.1 hypothetical protein [Acinetobacter defluvii]